MPKQEPTPVEAKAVEIVLAPDAEDDAAAIVIAEPAGEVGPWDRSDSEDDAPAPAARSPLPNEGEIAGEGSADDRAFFKKMLRDNEDLLWIGRPVPEPAYTDAELRDGIVAWLKSSEARFGLIATAMIAFMLSIFALAILVAGFALFLAQWMKQQRGPRLQRLKAMRYAVTTRRIIAADLLHSRIDNTTITSSLQPRLRPQGDFHAIYTRVGKIPEKPRPFAIQPKFENLTDGHEVMDIIRAVQDRL